MYRLRGMNLFRVLLHFLWPINCPVCGRPSVFICDSCIESLFWESQIINERENLIIYSAAYYHTDINKIILAFKYSGLKSLCRPIGRKMGKFLNRPEDVDYLLPVPLHVNSPRKYNQAHELALGLADSWDMKILDSACWTRETPTRAGMNAQERAKLAKDSFMINDNIDGLRIALVDDVCTTGITLMRLAEVCRDSGANVKYAYTLATVRGE